MKEYTLIYNAEITEVLKTDEPLENYVYSDKDQLGAWIESKLGVDDVHVKNVKVFERDL